MPAEKVGQREKRFDFAELDALAIEIDQHEGREWSQSLIRCLWLPLLYHSDLALMDSDPSPIRGKLRA